MPKSRPWKKKSARRASKFHPSLRRLTGQVRGVYTAPGSRYQFSRMLNQAQVFPTHVYKTFTYADYLGLSSLTVTNLTGARLAYRLNSLFDPDRDNTGTNHQPYQYDQISALYAYYRVYEVGYQITFTDPGTNSAYAAVMLTSSADTYSIASKLMYQIEEKSGGWTAGITDTGSRSTTCTGTVKIWELEGEDYSSWNGNSGYQATVGTSPVAEPLLQIAVGDYSAPVTPTSVRVLVKLVFKAKLFSPQTQLAS